MLTNAKKYWCETKEDALQLLSENGLGSKVDSKYPRGIVINNGVASLVFDREVYDAINIGEPLTAKRFVEFANKYLEGCGITCALEVGEDEDGCEEEYISFHHKKLDAFICSMFWLTRFVKMSYGDGEFQCCKDWDDPEALLKEILSQIIWGLEDTIGGFKEDIGTMTLLIEEIRKVAPDES